MILFSAILAGVLTAAPQKKVFRVSKVGKDKSELMDVYEAVRAVEFVKKYGEPRRFKVSQRISDGEFHGYFMKLVKIRFDAPAGMEVDAEGYVTARSGKKIKTHEWRGTGQRFLLKTSVPVNAADGEIIKDLLYSVTKETVSYTTVQGAKATVRVISQVVPKDEVISKKDFVFRLKAGETWNLKNVRETRCDDCVAGRRPALRGGGQCGTCGGDALVLTDYLVKW